MYSNVQIENKLCMHSNARLAKLARITNDTRLVKFLLVSLEAFKKESHV